MLRRRSRGVKMVMKVTKIAIIVCPLKCNRWSTGLLRAI